jgi:hypothetical protein
VQGLLNAATASTGAGGGGARAAERSHCEHGRRRGQCKGCRTQPLRARAPEGAVQGLPNAAIAI